MATIGSLVFCTDCGDLLPSTKGSARNVLTCECCGSENQDTGSKVIETKSKPSDFPSFLRQKLQSNVQNYERHNIQNWTPVQEQCPQCGRDDQTSYTEVQMRSADEGSTLMYRCECGQSWQQNN